MQTKTFILRDKAVINAAIAFIQSIKIDAIAPMQIEIKRHRKKRTNQNNATYWGRLTDISEQVVIEGRRFDPEIWHEQMKINWLPDECEKGVEKWKYLPNGDRKLNMSTSDLNTKEFYDYRLQVEADGAGMGVMFTTKLDY